MDNRFW